MKFVRLLNTFSLVIFAFIFACCVSYSQEFNADDITSFSSALQEANKTPDENHKINIGGNIILNSSLQEAISLQLVGTDDVNLYNFDLNGNSFTFNDKARASQISNLKVLANGNNGGISINGQTLNINNTNFTSTINNNSTSLITNRNGNMIIKNSLVQDNKCVNFGGGISVNGGSLSVINSKIINNTSSSYSGGGLSLRNCVGNFDNVEISNNKANANGGGLFIENSTIEIKNSTISNNVANQAAAMHIVNSDVTVDKTRFEKNNPKVGSQAGAVLNDGKKLTITNSNFYDNNNANGASGAILNKGELIIDNTTFEKNSSANEGGAINNSSNGTMKITNSNFLDNSSKNSFGGAILAGGKSSKIANCTFNNNSANQSYGGGAVMVMNSDVEISDCTFNENKAQSDSGRGGAITNYFGKLDLKGDNKFINNTANAHGGAIWSTPKSETNIYDSASFVNNSAKGSGGAIFVQGTVNVYAQDPQKEIVFAGNKDANGSNAFHLDVYSKTDPSYGVGTVNLNVANGSKIVLADDISGVKDTKLNITGTSSFSDNVYIGGENKNLESNVQTNNISLNFYNKMSGLPNAMIEAANTNFNFINGYITSNKMNLNLIGDGNSLSIDVNPSNFTSDYIDFVGSANQMNKLKIRDINVLSNPEQSVTIFDIFDHEKYGADLILSDELLNTPYNGAVKQYKWALTPRLTLIEMESYNPNIQRYQSATAAAFMNQMLSYDYSLNRTDEIYTNLREENLALRKLNTYASLGPKGLYVNHYFEDGSALWIRPYVNLESFHLSGLMGTLNNQSWGTMIGFDFPMRTSENNWKFVPTIYGAYIGSTQQFIDSKIYQNGGYGGLLLSAYYDDFYAGWTINGGGLHVESKYSSGKDDYAIVTAGTALKLAYNWKIKRFILQPNVTTAYTFLSPSNLVNFQSVDLNQTQVNGLTVAPSIRLTYRNETGFEPYVYGGCVIPIMSDIKATVNGEKLDDLHLNTWAQFGIGVRKRIKDRITFFAENIIRTGGRAGWGFMFNLQISI